MGGIAIPSPWDQILTVKVAAPRKEHVAIQQKAYQEALALTPDERLTAVRTVVASTMQRVLAVLPHFYGNGAPG
jgi:hypothetical protein